MKIQSLFFLGFLMVSCMSIGIEPDVCSGERKGFVHEEQLEDFWEQALDAEEFESRLEMEPIPLVRLWVMKIGGPFVLYYFALKNKIGDWYYQLKMKLKKNWWPVRCLGVKNNESKQYKQ